MQAFARKPLALATIVGCLIATGARAEVLEIAADGAVTTIAGPSVFTDSGIARIQGDAATAVARPGDADVAATILAAAQRYALSPALVDAVAWRESGYRQAAVSPRDAVGVMQLTAGTARELGVDRHDLTQNVHGGAAYLSRMLGRYSGDVRLALAAYNAGPGAVDRHRGLPPFPETQAYVAAIMGRLAQRAPVAPAVAAAVLTVAPQEF